MKAFTCWSVIGLLALLTAGCGNNGSTAEDDAFQQQLAAAAAKNKDAGQAAGKSRGQLPPGVSAKMGAPPTKPGDGK